MRSQSKVSVRMAVTVAAGIVMSAISGLLLFSAFGASALERAGLAPLVAAGPGFAALVLLALRAVQRSLRRGDLDRELRQLLEEEANKPT